MSEDMTDVATGGDTTIVDLQDLVADLEAERDELERRRDAARDQDPDADDPVEWPPAEWAGVDRPVLAIKHSIDLLEADIDRFGGSEFVITKARAGEAARAVDMVAEDSASTDRAPTAQVASSKHRMVQVCVERAPPDAPTTADGRLATMSFEEPTFQHLYTAIDNYNTYGRTSLEDF